MLLQFYELNTLTYVLLKFSYAYLPTTTKVMLSQSYIQAVAQTYGRTMLVFM